MSRICLVGAGNISRVHADALKRIPGHSVAAVVDPNLAAARRLADSVGASGVFTSVEEALQADAFDRAHVLVPPDVHCTASLPLLRAGKPVLVEKPLATSMAECDAMQSACDASGAILGTNQNFVHHPAFVRLRRLISETALGRPNFVGCLYNVSLKQMVTRQFGHWMFHVPLNILLEQAVHPLSQIVALAGPVQDLRAIAGPPVEIAPGLPFYPALNALLTCRDLPAQMRFVVGQNFPIWQLTVVCDDGIVVADMLADRVFTYGRTRWLEAVDLATSGLRTAGGIARDSVRNLSNYALSTLHMKERTDSFYVSMKGSIAAFHAAVDAGTKPELDGQFGAHLVQVCEAMRDQAFPAATKPAAAATTIAAPATVETTITKPADVAILGGTGFIGAHVVRRFVEAGQRVSVMARTLRNLPAIFSDPHVTLHRGDIRNAEAVADAIGTAPVVVNLAHGGGGSSWEEIRNAMVGGAETVAKVCLEKRTRRLIHVGSIASLYLGPQKQPLTGATPSDPQEEKRGDYARAKVICDRMLLEMHAREGLQVCILRPGVVVGEGSAPFHSGLGFYNNEQHCIGWNAGRNKLPFVLVEDVAEAIFLASRAEGVDGHCYNLVGDVQPTAREYTAELSRALRRPLRFHPQFPRQLWLEDYGKWVVKRATGRKVPAPSFRDFLSRGLLATFDCSDAKRDLGWSPVADPDRFAQRAILVHAR